MSASVEPDELVQQRTPGPDEVEEPTGDLLQGSARYGSDRLLDLIRELGCRYLPSNPGSSFRGFHDSIVNYGGNRDPQFLLCHNELIAVACAHGYAKAAQRTGFAVVHDLVGLMQASMGIYNAFVDEAPIVLLGGGGPADTTQRRPIDWIHSASAQTQLVRDFVKWDAEPVDLRGTEEALAQAARLSAAVPMGPTYVTLDAGVQERALDDTEAWPSVVSMGQAPTGLALNAGAAWDVAQALVAADRPVIVVGPMGYAGAATEAVVALAEPLGAACLDVDHATVIPSEFALNLTGEPAVLQDADLVLAIGVRDIRAIAEPVLGRREGTRLRDGLDTTIIDIGLRDLTLRGWGAGSSSSTRVSQRFTAEPIGAARDLAAKVANLLAKEAPEQANRRNERRAAVERRHRTILAAGQEAVAARWDETPIAPGRMVKELWDVVKDAPWQLAMRNTRTFPAGVWRFDDANDYLGHSGGAGVGYGPGAMVGAALGAMETGRLAIGIGGDGDFLMHPGALWTAAHYRVPMLLVINDNASFYNDEDHQVAVARDRGRPEVNGYIGMRMENPRTDIAALARGYGAWAVGPIEDTDELADAFRAGLEAALAGQTAVVHVRTAPT